MLGAQQIHDAINKVHPRTAGAYVAPNIRIGRDSSDEDAIWVYVIVPDDRIDEFYGEWDQVRADIRQRVREKFGDVWVYIHMRATSEVNAAGDVDGADR